jgi:hypothetical protein
VMVRSGEALLVREREAAEGLFKHERLLPAA